MEIGELKSELVVLQVIGLHHGLFLDVLNPTYAEPH